MKMALLVLGAFLAVELAVIQRSLGNREHYWLCLAAAAALVVVAIVDGKTGAGA